MDDWLVLGLGAALVYAVSGLASKIALSDKYVGVDPATAGIYVAVGVAVVFIAYYLCVNGLALPEADLKGKLSSAAVGFFWALGVILVFTALMRHADISRMAPIYNLNTLIIVLLGIILLRELPGREAALRVAAGAVLIILGGILVSS